MKIAAGMSEEFAAKVLRLRADFIETFAQRARTLGELADDLGAHGADPQRLARLRTEVHQLKGSAGMYQLDELYAIARDAELGLDDMREESTESVNAAAVARLLAPVLAALARDDW